MPDTGQTRRPAEAAPKREVVLLVDVNLVDPDPNQPRQEFDEAKLKELELSLQSVGQQQPATLRRNPDAKGRFILIDGERRWRCLVKIEFPKIKAIIKRGDVDSEEAHVKSVLANWNREGHTPIETMRAVVRVLRYYNNNFAETAAAFGKSDAWVRQYLMLSRLPEAVLRYMEPPIPKRERLKMPVALLLVPLEADMQLALAKQFHERKTNVAWAKRTITRRLENLGIRRKQNAGHDRSKVVNFLVRMSEQLEVLNEMSANDITYAFRGKKDDIELATTLTKDIAEKLAFMRRRIRKLQGTPAEADVDLDIDTDEAEYLPEEIEE